MKSSTQMLGLLACCAILVGCEMYPYVGPPRPSRSGPAGRPQVSASYTATCLHPTCSRPAPRSSRSLMLCEYHAHYRMSPGERSLMSAVKSCDHSRLRESLQTVDPNFLGDDSLPPVYWAVRKRDLVALKLLEASGASLHWTRADGNSLAFDAASNGDNATLAYLSSKGVSQRGVSDGRMARAFIGGVGEAVRNPPPPQQGSYKCHRCGGSGHIGTATSYTNCPECNGLGRRY